MNIDILLDDETRDADSKSSLRDIQLFSGDAIKISLSRYTPSIGQACRLQ